MLMLAMPFPYIANEAGWVVAEVGRQPWIVYGLQRVAHASSANVTAGMTYSHAVRVHGPLPRGRPALPAAVRAHRERGPAMKALMTPPGSSCSRSLLAVYAVLDGFDLGLGAVHLLLGSDARERDAADRHHRSRVERQRGVAARVPAASMVRRLSQLYAASFSGFYLALMLVLWLLLLRGLGIEFRHQITTRCGKTRGMSCSPSPAWCWRCCSAWRWQRLARRAVRGRRRVPRHVHAAAQSVRHPRRTV